MSRLTRDGTAEPVSRDQILRHARGQGNVHFPCSADHEQDWQPYPVDPYAAICDDHTYIPSSGNPFKYHEEVLYLQPMIPPTSKRFDIFPPDWGMLRRSRCVHIPNLSFNFIFSVNTVYLGRYFQHAHIIPIVGVGKRGVY